MLVSRLDRWTLWLPLLGWLLVCAPSRGDEPPLFRPPVEHEQVAAALQVLGAGGEGQTGPLVACVHLATGNADEVRVWQIRPPVLSPRFQISSGATTAILAGAGSHATGPLPGGLSALAAIRWGDSCDFWTLRDTTQVEPIPVNLLPFIKDQRGIPAAETGDMELDAYFHFLLVASRASTTVLEENAAQDVTYSHLFNDPARYRGRVIELQGQLKRIRKFDAPLTAKMAGIHHLYEGWVFYKSLGANPFCILFTDLPPGLRVAEEMDVPVKFAGYFYKRYRYTPADQPQGKTNYKRDAPMLIGHAPTPTGPPVYPSDPSQENWAKSFLPIFVGGIFLTVIGVFGMIIWTRVNERTVKKRLGTIRPPVLNLPEPDESPAEPTEEPVTPPSTPV